VENLKQIRDACYYFTLDNWVLIEGYEVVESFIRENNVPAQAAADTKAAAADAEAAADTKAAADPKAAADTKASSNAAADKIFLKHISVVYTDAAADMPPNAVREQTNQNNDINAGFGGKKVYLVIELTDKPNEAITKLSIQIQSSVDPSKDDLTKGAGGVNRYIIETRLDPTAKYHRGGNYWIQSINNSIYRVNPIKASTLILRRSKSSVDAEPGWQQTTNINEGRGGDYLYLLHKKDFA